MKMRLQKFLSQAGVASRRRAEKLIAEGQVLVNGKVVRKMGVVVDTEKDVVRMSPPERPNGKQMFGRAGNAQCPMSNKILNPKSHRACRQAGIPNKFKIPAFAKATAGRQNSKPESRTTNYGLRTTNSGRQISMTNKKLYFIINKPAGYVCSRNRQNNEKIIYDLLPKELRQKVWSVGRLDKESEGLLILTNDGELTQKLTHPKFEHEKEYGVILDRPLSVKDEKILVKGVVIDGSKTTPVKILNIQGKKLNIILKEGRNRQLRRMFGKMGYRVEQLVRIRVGRLKLSGLRLGCFKKISRDDVL